MVERGDHQLAPPARPSNRPPEERPGVGVGMANQDVAGLRFDAPHLVPVVVDDVVPGLEAPTELAADGVRVSRPGSVGIDEVDSSPRLRWFAAGRLRPGRVIRPAHGVTSADAGGALSRFSKRRMYQLWGTTPKANWAITLP